MQTPTNPSARKYTAYFLISFLLIQTTGCQFFQYITYKDDQLQSLRDIGEQSKFFFVHTGTDIYNLKDVSMNDKQLTGVVYPPNEGITPYYEPGRNEGYSPRKEGTIIHEVHITLINDAYSLTPGHVSIPLDEISEIKILEKNRRKSKAVTTFVFIGSAAMAAGLLTLLVFVGTGVL